MTPSPWTPETEAAIKRLHAEGLPYSAIATKLGISKNACIGKAKRLGIANRRQITRPEHNYVWTPESVAKLKAWWAEGLSQEAIGERLGISRNAVASKVKKLRRRGVVIKAHPIGRPAGSNVIRLRPRTNPPRVAVNAPPSLDLSVYELTDSTCKYPVTDRPPHRFCGHRSLAGGPYCRSHWLISRGGAVANTA